jgi:hypothetical protein
VGNAAIIDTGDKTLVIDSLRPPGAPAEATRLTGRAVFLLVNTHWHSDLGQPGRHVPIIGTERTVGDGRRRPADLGDYGGTR